MCLWCVSLEWVSPTHLHFIHSPSQGKRYRKSCPSSPATDLPYIAYIQDLSLLTHMTHEDIQHLQSVGKEAQQARQEFILKDDQHKVWDYIKTLHGGRVDFVLDNAGFEVILLRGFDTATTNNNCLLVSSSLTLCSRTSWLHTRRMFRR